VLTVKVATVSISTDTKNDFIRRTSDATMVDEGSSNPFMVRRHRIFSSRSLHRFRFVQETSLDGLAQQHQIVEDQIR
jgi:hypothetical protein